MVLTPRLWRHLRFAGVAVLAQVVLLGCTSASYSSNVATALDCDDRFTRCASKVASVSPSEKKVVSPSLAQTPVTSEQPRSNAAQTIVPPTIEPIKFEFDASTVLGVNLRAAAEYLMQHPSSNLTLHGYADPIGSEDYNLVLAEKRALHIRERLMIAGVDRRQISVVSHGEQGLLVEELPANQAVSEAVQIMLYAPNRRVAFEFTQPSSIALSH